MADRRVRAALAGEAPPDHDEQFWQVLGNRLIAEARSRLPRRPSIHSNGSNGTNGSNVLRRLPRKRTRLAVHPSGRGGLRRRRPTRSHPQWPSWPSMPNGSEEVRPKWRRRVVRDDVHPGAERGPRQCGLVRVERRAGLATTHRPPGRRFDIPPPDRIALCPRPRGRSGARCGRWSIRVRALLARIQPLPRNRPSQRQRVRRDHRAAQAWRIGPGGATDATSDTGLAPGPPDADGASQYLQGDDLGTIIHALYGLRTTLGRSGTRQGQKVWIFNIRLAATAAAPVGGMQVIVDQRRGVPIEMSRSVNGAVVERKQFSVLRSASGVRQDTFRLAFPLGVSPAPFDNGFIRTQLPDASGLIGYLPATPEWLPPAFELSTVAVLRGSPIGLPSTAAGDNPPNRERRVDRVSPPPGPDHGHDATRRRHD